MATYEDIVNHSNTQVRCILCNVFVQNNHHNIGVHIDGANHSNLYYDRLKIRNNIICRTTLLCLICDAHIYSLHADEDCLTSVKRHVEEEEHINNMESINDLIENEFLQLPENITPLGSKVHCNVCDCNIGFRYQVINEHINGRKHELARSIAVQPLNGIFSVEGTDDELWCKICDENIDNYVDTILEHVYDDEKHSSGLAEIEDTIGDEDISIKAFLEDVSEYKAYCNECSVWVPCNPYNLQQHIEGERHTQ